MYCMTGIPEDHAWQFSDHQHFKVEFTADLMSATLYDNYYTGGLNKNAVISNADTHHVDTQHCNGQAEQTTAT